MKDWVTFDALVISVMLLLLCGFALGKECSNSVSNISTNEFRNVNPKDITEADELNWEIMVNQTIQNTRKFKAPIGFLQEVSLHDVRLEPNSLHWQAQQTNLNYLLMLDPDRLVWSFRKLAGLPTPGVPYGGWEEPTSALRGHFVGHYLSATAQMWAATHNDTIRQKMSAVVQALQECQQKIGSGYLSAFPEEQFDRVEAIVYVWAPYYTIHKIMAGLLDQHTLADDTRALKMLTWMVDYFYNRVQKLILRYTIAKHYVSLNEETGGMNEVLYRLYKITGNPKHLMLAHLFDKSCFLGGLALQQDELFDFHANTHIPIVVGTQVRYEMFGDPIHKELSTFFMDIVNSSHAFATGGTSIEEFWREPKRLASYLIQDNEESCATYNMLKISRHLFRWTKLVAYADYYERALTNGVLSIQRGTEPGVMIYFLPQAPGSTKMLSHWGWGTPFNTFWCCYGTGIESFSKLGDSIYFEEGGKIPVLYIIQYISSTLTWKTGQFVLTQIVNPVVSWDPFLRVTMTFNMKGSQSATLNLRIPTWTSLQGAKALINGQNLPVPAPGNFLPVKRVWSSHDKIDLQLPLSLRLEQIKDDRPTYRSLQAILYGPYLLAGHTTGDWTINNVSASSLSSWITPIPADYNNHLVTFFQQSGNSTKSLMNGNNTIIMGTDPSPGNNSALYSTFRLILADNSSKKISTIMDAVGELVMLEPIDQPGMKVVYSQTEKNLGLVVAKGGLSVFRLVPGLDKRKGTVSLETDARKGCFVSAGGVNKAAAGDQSLKLGCNLDISKFEVTQAASFLMDKGMSQYHPISFVAKGGNKSYLLEPILSYRSETYTIYFDIKA